MNELWRIGSVEWLATFLALAAPLAALLRIGSRKTGFQVVILAACAVVPAIPISGLRVSQYFLTIVGHLSITSMTLFAVVLVRELSGKRVWKNGERTTVFIAVVLSGLLLYPAAFGLVVFDGYQLGYRSLPFVVVLMGITVIAAVARRNVAFAILLAAVAAYQLRFLQSVNLWDYLLDPSLAIFATGALIYSIGRRSSPSPRAKAAQSTENQ